MKARICSLRPLLNYYAVDRPIDWAQVFDREAPLVVEIGFGMGEVLMRKALEFPDHNFVGIEFHWERIFKTVKAIGRDSVLGGSQDNIRILRVDANVAFERFFVDRSIDHIYSLFPCPWPKKSHVKHRLFSEQFLGLLNNRLKDGSELQIVTDDYAYFQWVQEQHDPRWFEIQSDEIKPQFDTKFERKWIEEGQEEFFELRFKKNEHVSYRLHEDVELKSYRIEHFDPDKFEFENLKGEVAVVLKDRFYDPEQKLMLLRVIVHEQQLMQNFWIMIRQDKKFWRMCKMEGQQFFPTPGINVALDAVHKAIIDTN